MLAGWDIGGHGRTLLIKVKSNLEKYRASVYVSIKVLPGSEVVS